MKVKSYIGKFNNDNSTFGINTCHMYLKTNNGGYKSTLIYETITESDKIYLNYISRLFKKVSDIVFKHNKENKTINFEIKPNSKRGITYACFVLYRFSFIQHCEVLTKKWADLCKQYPKKNKFKLLLWMNNKYKNPNTELSFYIHNFYLNDVYLTKYYIQEMISFADFLKKDFTYPDLNSKFKVEYTFPTSEEKYNKLNEILKKL